MKAYKNKMRDRQAKQKSSFAWKGTSGTKIVTNCEMKDDEWL